MRKPVYAPAFVVDLVAIARCVDNVQAEANAVLDNDYISPIEKIAAYSEESVDTHHARRGGSPSSASPARQQRSVPWSRPSATRR